MLCGESLLCFTVGSREREFVTRTACDSRLYHKLRPPALYFLPCANVSPAHSATNSHCGRYPRPRLDAMHGRHVRE